MSNFCSWLCRWCSRSGVARLLTAELGVSPTGTLVDPVAMTNVEAVGDVKGASVFTSSPGPSLARLLPLLGSEGFTLLTYGIEMVRVGLVDSASLSSSAIESAPDIRRDIMGVTRSALAMRVER